MTTDGDAIVPVWTLATKDTSLMPAMPLGGSLTPERLDELRSALAAFADAPVATLEAHPLPKELDRSNGIALDAMSPLARELARLVSETAKSAPQVVRSEAAEEVLYRMVVPAKVAAEVGKGLVKPMASKAISGGVHSALRSSSGITAHATFVPVTSSAATGGVASTATAGAAGAEPPGQRPLGRQPREPSRSQPHWCSWPWPWE